MMKKTTMAGAVIIAGAMIAYATPAYASTATQLPVSGTGMFGGFNDVATVSASDAWAVGGNGNGMIQRFNGTRFTTVASPTLLDGSANAWASLNAVDVLSATAAYAVGGATGASGSPAVALRWNGSQWSKLAATGATGSFTGVKAFSANDVWAVGDDTSSAVRRTTLAMHFNGTSWTRLATPSPGTRNNNVTDVDGSAPNDVWAVGYSLNLPYGNRIRNSMILHWNGSQWSQVTSPNNGSTFLYDVVALSATDAWAVGSGSSGGALVLRWNGTAWNSVAAPALSSLSGVAARSGTDVWVSGSDAAGAPAVAHWNGTAWQVTPVTVTGGAGFPGLTAIATSAATTELAAGYQADGTTGQSSSIAFRVAG
jgi:hypothetical protein